MYSRRFKTGYFVLEGLNSAATVYFLYYFYFYMERVFGFGNKANLCLAALNGGTYALVALMPGIAQRLELSTTLAGFLGSLWCFARFGAFVGLWLWPGWHYRFRWLLTGYLGLVGSFITILRVPNLPVLVAAQMVFGGAVGLTYYSSLFYSMDSSETKGEHGGIHESVIGLGNCAGPAVGAAAQRFLPQYGHSGALAVTCLLLCGLGGLTAIWWLGRGT